MKLRYYNKKATKVQAMQWVSEADAIAILQWVLMGRWTASYHHTDEPGGQRIEIQTRNGAFSLFRLEWLVLEENGSFLVYNQRTFSALYDAESTNNIPYY